ncbi:unnamed protein product [Phytophthora lilii]|uniref:Unnamed protein product n=1 Tax=Phytophthora lilii TaxID=2077276 RepID=A0A9W7CU52_9STRA|nr:unnamed protein product [Phytophthora lilii]
MTKVLLVDGWDAGREVAATPLRTVVKSSGGESADPARRSAPPPRQREHHTTAACLSAFGRLRRGRVPESSRRDGNAPRTPEAGRCCHKMLRRFDQHAEFLVLKTMADESCLHYAESYSSSEELQRVLRFCELWPVDAKPQDEVVGGLLNCVDSSGHTAFILASTHTIDSREERNAKRG